MDAADWAELWAGKLAAVLASQTFPAWKAEDQSDEFWEMVAFMAGDVPTPVTEVRNRAVYLAELAELERNEFAVTADAEAWTQIAVEDGVDRLTDDRCKRQEAGLF